ncbi:MAG: SDR family oxidoreductase [Nitrospirales bacterium]|nr:SDR family oxidoreductase [Nitrospira sp.]MDR4502349.1 SDR family oxidoreductase [Nitrospirales bacterium]
MKSERVSCNEQIMRRILVTGGAGFIGSHLVDRLIHDGHHVWVLDNFSTGRPENLAHLSGHPRLSVSQGDVTDRKVVDEVMTDIHWVFHLASLADIVPSMVNPLTYYHANVSGTATVVESARQAGIQRFVYTASSSCYGLPDVYPTPETAEIRPQYPYALTKNLGEQIVMHWAQTYGLPVVSLRLFNVYGPRARTSGTYGAVFGVFLAQKLARKPFTVIGDGTQTRDFTYVTDVVDAFVKAAESQCAEEIFNIGSGGTYSINHLVDLLRGPVVHIPKRPGEPDCTFASIEKARSMLNWTPTMTFEEGVSVMLQHIQAWEKAPVWDPESIAVASADWFRYLGRGTTELANCGGQVWVESRY